MRDIRYALRSLAARPSYAVVTLATIALLVGAGSAVLAVIDAALVRPLPFRDADRLVQIFTWPPGLHSVAERNPLASIDFIRFRDRLRLVDGLAGQWARERAIGSDGEPESVPATAVSSNFFAVLGVAPARGRTFTEDEDRANAKVVVLSDALWQRRFGGKPDAIGQRLAIDREDYEIVGVMPASFNPAFVVSQLWTPLGVYEGNVILPNATYIQSIARLRPGASVAQLKQELAVTMAGVGKEQPVSRGGWTTDASTMRDAQFGQARPALLILLAAIAALGLIAAANLTNLTVAEVANRRGEIVLRSALGAGRRDLLRLYAIEGLVLAVAGGALGLALAAVTLPVVLALDPTTATLLSGASIDWRVATAASVLALTVSSLSGVWPVLGSTRGDIARALAEGGRRGSGSRRQRRVRFALVAAETLLSVVLLTSGALLLSSFDHAAKTDPGFDPRQVLGAQVRLSATAYPTFESRAGFVNAIVDRVRAAPGIVDAGVTLNRFIPGFAFVSLINIDGKPSPDGQPYTVQFRRTGPGYFRTMRIPVVRGRDFDAHDVRDSLQVAVVSRQLAERYWPGEDAVGRRLQRTTDLAHWMTIVGVVGDVSDVGFGQPPAPTIYVPYGQNNVVTAPVGLVVRTSGDPNAALKTVTAAIHEIDPAQPLSGVTTLDSFLRDSLGPDRFRSVLLLVFASLGLLLAAVGIYGVTSRGVAERVREVGVRLALGCEPGAIWRLIVRQSLAAVVAGFVVGVPLAIGAAVALRHWLPGLDSAAPLAVLPALAALAAAGFVAAALPAARAMRVDPLTALRRD